MSTAFSLAVSNYEARKRVACAEKPGAPFARRVRKLFAAIIPMLGRFLTDRESDQPGLVVVVEKETALLRFAHAVCLTIGPDKILRGHNHSMVKFFWPGARIRA